MSDDVEHERKIIQSWPDNSAITQDRYRTNSVAPWIEGLCTVHCGTCDDEIGEEDSTIAAQIAMLSHILMHVQDELSAYRSAFYKLWRSAAAASQGRADAT